MKSAACKLDGRGQQRLSGLQAMHVHSRSLSFSGGDGLVAARHLWHYCYMPTIYYPKQGSNDIYQVSFSWKFSQYLISRHQHALFHEHALLFICLPRYLVATPKGTFMHNGVL